MCCKNISPYALSSKLEEKGWLSFEDKICIPFPPECDKYKYLSIKQERRKKYVAYTYGFVKEDDGKLEECKSFTRDIPPVEELTKQGWTLSVGERVDSAHLGTQIRRIYGLDDVDSETMKEFVKNALNLIKNEKGLQILKNKRYVTSQRTSTLKKEKNSKKHDKKTLQNNEDSAYQSNKKFIVSLFSERKQIGKAQQGLARCIKSKYDLILRKNSNELYVLDDESNSYTEVTFDELFILVSKEIGYELINEKDLKEAITYISDRRDPQHNIVRFKNCLFDMGELKAIHTDKPVFTLIESNYNYNPEAKSTVLANFLQTSLKKESDSDTQETIKCLKQLTGYLFTSGNRLNVLPMIIGISGGGKSVFANILTAIFGKNKVADLKLQEISKDPHATSSLVNKHLNIIQDSDASSINNNSLIKQITGNDQLQVNPKYVQPFVLPPEEVPKSILIGNNIPLFTHLEPALIERFLIIEFNVKFRGEDGEDPDLLKKILDDPEEIEWFIYQSLEEYKNMITNGEDFILRKEGKETRDLVNKHQTPLNYLFRQIIDGFSYTNWDIAKKIEKSDEDGTAKEIVEEYYVYTNDLKDEITSLAETKGIDLELNSKGEIPAKQMINVIRNEFDLWATNVRYESKTRDGRRYYPHLIPTDSYKEQFKNRKQEAPDEKDKS